MFLRRSKSDPFRDSLESITVDFPQTSSIATSTDASPIENPVIITPRKYNGTIFLSFFSFLAAKLHYKGNYKRKIKIVSTTTQVYPGSYLLLINIDIPSYLDTDE
jgi:hypothetical protein